MTLNRPYLDTQTLNRSRSINIWFFALITAYFITIFVNCISNRVWIIIIIFKLMKYINNWQKQHFSWFCLHISRVKMSQWVNAFSIFSLKQESSYKVIIPSNHVRWTILTDIKNIFQFVLYKREFKKVLWPLRYFYDDSVLTDFTQLY